MLSDWAVSVEMAQVSKVPVSRLIKQGEDEDGPTKKSRDEYRKAKELEEARYKALFNFFGVGDRGGVPYKFGWDLAEWLERLTANAVVATVLSSISASSDIGKSEGRQMKQCGISYIKKKKSPFICLDPTAFRKIF
jgi:hypothetical protein